MRYIVCQDLHILGRSSINRIDNYFESIMAKFGEILSIAKKNKVKAILDGGDLFENHTVANTIIDEVLDLIEDSKIQWKMLFGNHCQIGHNVENSKSTSLQHMFNRSDYVEHLTLIPDVDKFKYIIEGKDYYHGIEQDLKENGLYSQSKNAEFKVALVHALIVEKPLPTEMCITIDEVKTDFDVVFVAHNHKQFDITKNKTRFINLGCIGRRKTDESDIKPRVAILDTDTKEIEIIYLKNVKKGSEVFDLEEVAKNKEYENEVNNFVTSLKEEKFEELDLLGIIEKLAKESKLDNEIKEEIIRRIE